jgi:hypothetical protein
MGDLIKMEEYRKRKEPWRSPLALGMADHYMRYIAPVPPIFDSIKHLKEISEQAPAILSHPRVQYLFKPE